MRNIKIICLITLLFTIAIPVQSSHSGQQKKQKTVVTIGDSTTSGNKKIVSYREFLARDLPVLIPNEKWRFILAGSGDTTRTRANFGADVLVHNPDIVVIQLGIHDSLIDFWKTDKVRVPLMKYRQKLQYSIDELKERNAQILLMTPNKLFWSPSSLAVYGFPPYQPEKPYGFNLLLEDYAEEVRKLASENNLPLIDVYEFYTYETAKVLMPDGMHPESIGHRKVANAIEEIIIDRHVNELLTQMRRDGLLSLEQVVQTDSKQDNIFLQA